MQCCVKGYDAKRAKLDGKPLELSDRIIMLRSDITHTEWQFSPRYAGWSFSFTKADKADGARFKAITYSHPNRWVNAPWPLTDEQEDDCWAAACTWANIPTFAPNEMRLMLKHQTDTGIIQGPKHHKYDTVGLLTHALKPSDKVWLNLLRGVLWGWTLVVQAHPTKQWCSRSSGKLAKIGEPAFMVNPDTLDPAECVAAMIAYRKNLQIKIKQ